VLPEVLRRRTGRPGAAFRLSFPPMRLFLLLASLAIVGCQQVPVTGRSQLILVDEGEVASLSAAEWRYLKRKGFSDKRLAKLMGTHQHAVRAARQGLGVRPVYKRVDTCAAVFATQTAYMYSTYEEECVAAPTNRKKVMVLGGGPNRIGQGIEFDYCCVHAALAMREDGYETIMVNCNPETVSTDYDTSDRLYFEPVTLEDVLEIVDKEKPVGVIVQYGGQTPLKLALDLERAGVPIIGTSPDSIDIAEDRERFQKLLHELGLKQPPNRTARTEEQAMALAQEIGYPLVVRPSYVLGGRAMEIVHGDKDLERYMREAVRVSEKSPVLLDRFLDDAIEVDVDCISDGTEVMIGGIMEHVEAAGIHSGDSACSLPPYSLSPKLQDEMRRQATEMAKALKVVGLMNTQFAVQGEGDDAVVYVLEVNPRASRTVPFVSKATGQSLAKIAARCMAGQKLKDQKGLGGVAPHEVVPPFFSIKEAVFPFNKFPGVDPILGPEMRSTGEVMGVGHTFGEAMLKSQLGAGSRLPEKGTVVITVKNSDKDRAVKVASDLVNLGFNVVATKGTAAAIAAAGIPVKVVNKVKDGRPHIADMVKAGEIQLVFTTVDETRTAIADSRYIRTAALANRVTYYTTMAGCEAATEALKHEGDLQVFSLQELHAELH
ncbi:MAG: carbamoyl-phosphate synthase large subunit, partial [Rubrivivax sp.]